MNSGFIIISAVHLTTNAIGDQNGMLWKSPRELSWFKNVTSGHVIAMGRKTFECLQAPLKNRVNVVITRDVDGFILMCNMRGLQANKLTAHSLVDSNSALYVTDNLQLLFDADRRGKELFIAGGSQIYTLALDPERRNQCKAFYISRMSFSGSTLLDSLDEHPHRKEVISYMPVLQADMQLVSQSSTLIDPNSTARCIANNISSDLNNSLHFDICCFAYPEHMQYARYMFDQRLFGWLKQRLGLSWESEYQSIIRQISEHGCEQVDRTQIGTRSVFGKQLRFDMSEGAFPLLSLKRTPLKSIFLELMWIINGYTDAKWLSDRKVSIWNGNSSKQALEQLGLPYNEGDCGPIYGFQLRHFGAQYTDSQSAASDSNTNQGVDQWTSLLKGLKETPFSRRHIVSFWNPAVLNQVCLPACHVLYQFNVQQRDDYKYLNLQVYQRSADMLLGVPFNMASYALLLALVAHHCGYQRGELILTLGDCHVYNNQTEGLDILNRVPMPAAQLILKHASSQPIESVQFADIQLVNYNAHSTIKLPMAV